MQHDQSRFTSHKATPALHAATWADFQFWATENEAYGTVREIAKVPARLGIIHQDAGLIPADLAYFDRVIAGSSFATVSKSQDLKVARNQSNSRVRNALKRFTIAYDPKAQRSGRDQWTTLIQYVDAGASMPGRGGDFNVSNVRGLETLRARMPVAPAQLTQRIVDEACRQASAEKRKAIRRGLKFLNRLITQSSNHQEIAGLLPKMPFSSAAGSSRARPIEWSSLPEAFRASCVNAFRRTIGNPEDRVADAEARIAAGADPLKVFEELEQDARDRTDVPGNEEVAEASYRSAVSWLVRAAETLGTMREELSEITDVMTYEVIIAATKDQIARSRAADDLKDPEKSQTLRKRLTTLDMIAKHGVGRDDIKAFIALAKKIQRWMRHRTRQKWSHSRN